MMLNLIYLVASWLSVEHRPQTKRRDPRLSCAAAYACRQFFPLSCISLSMFRLHVFLIFLSWDDFQYRDCFGIHVSFLRNVWSKDFHSRKNNNDRNNNNNNNIILLSPYDGRTVHGDTVIT